MEKLLGLVEEDKTFGLQKRIFIGASSKSGWKMEGILGKEN